MNGRGLKNHIRESWIARGRVIAVKRTEYPRMIPIRQQFKAPRPSPSPLIETPGRIRVPEESEKKT